jgi:hypothetical protein
LSRNSRYMNHGAEIIGLFCCRSLLQKRNA